MAHLLAVAALVMEYGGNEDEAIAALLHDAVEDQGGEATLEEIRRRFGSAVAEIVEGCTDTLVTPKPPWRQRKEAYLARLAKRVGLGAAGLGGRQAAQRTFDRPRVSPTGRVGVEFFPRRPRRHALVLSRGGRNAPTAGGNPLVEELQRTVAEMESMADAASGSLTR